jgi:hypothetical protein
MISCGLFNIPNDILDIIKYYYWKIKHKGLIRSFTLEWRKRRPHYVISYIYRNVHEGRAFLKGSNVGALIDSNFNKKTHIFINGKELIDVIKFKHQPMYEQFMYGLRFRSPLSLENIKYPEGLNFKDKVKYIMENEDRNN